MVFTDPVLATQRANGYREGMEKQERKIDDEKEVLAILLI